MEKLRLGMIGIGNMGTQVANMLIKDKKCPDIVVTAMCDTDEDRQKWIRDNFASHGVEIFGDAEQMFVSGKVDAVYIASPHYDHPTLAMLAFRYKLHVMIEKPAGVYTKAVREMNDAAKKAGVKFGIMFQSRTSPALIKAKELLDSGYYGEIRSVTWLVTSWYRSQFYYDSGSWRATWAGEGGGVLLNQAPHNLDLLQWLCGMPVEVTAKCSVAQWHDVEIEDDVSAILRYKNGALGTFITSTGVAPGTNRLEIATDRGTFVIDKSYYLTVNELQYKEQDYSKTVKSVFDFPKSSTIKYDMYEEKENGHIIVLNAFANAVLNGGKLIADGSEGINSLTLANAMYLSSWLNKTIELPIDENLYYEELKKRIATSKIKHTKSVVAGDMSSSYDVQK